MTDAVLETQGLTKFYGKTIALDHLDLRVRRGSVYGLLGRNGAGKTTAIKLILGLLRPTAGRASILGCDCQALTPRIRQRIGYVTEGHHLYRWMTIGRIEEFQRAFFPGQWNAGLFRDMLDYFELPKSRRIKHLSNGQRAQVSLALALAPDPELLIMDDPTLGLDTAIRRQFLEGMILLIQRQGKSILFSSHILSDVERVADRVAVIDRGVLRADCTMEEFRAAIRKVRVSFTGPLPERVDLPGLLHTRAIPDGLELTLVKTTDEQLQSWAESVSADEYRLEAMNLEDQFIEYTAPAHGRKLLALGSEKEM